MSRTPEQVAADDKLTEAIQEARAAYGYAERGEVLVEYAVIAATRVFADDGEVDDSLVILLRDNSVPVHTAIGMFRYASVRYEHSVNCDAVDDED